MKEKRVVVTGIGVVSPVGNSIKEFFDHLCLGSSGIEHISELEKYNFNCQVGGIPKLNDSLLNDEYLNSLSGDFTKYALIAAKEALGLKHFLPHENNTDFDTGVIIGTGFGSIDGTAKSLIPLVSEGNTRKIRSTFVESAMISAPSSLISGLIGSGNFCFSNSNACATGTDAIAMGYERIIQGLAKKMIVGSSDCYAPYYWAMFDSLRVTNRFCNHDPKAASRPMSESARGFVPSAGAGIIVLEELENASENNSIIYAEIAGAYSNCGGQRNGGSMTAPNPDGVIKCILTALEQARISGSHIDLISGHLTGTKADPIEVNNWLTALGIHAKDFPWINAPKSMLGHTLGASGSIEAIAAILQLYHGKIHPSINCNDIHQEILKIIPGEKIPQSEISLPEIQFVAKASFGFGDVNSCVIFKKFS